MFAKVQEGEGYRQARHFFPELSFTSLPTKLLELARAYAHGVEMLLLLLCDALVLLCVLEMRRREPSFIGGEEGSLWKCSIPSWKVQNCLQTDI